MNSQLCRPAAFLFPFLISLMLVPQLRAQEDSPQAMIEACIQVQKEHFRPLKESMDGLYAKFSNMSSINQRVIRWLEANPDTAEAKRQAGIRELTVQLEALKNAESLTTGASLTDVKATIEKIHSINEDLQDNRRDEMRPFEKQRSALQRKYRSQEEATKAVLKQVFYKKGNNELTEKLELSYVSFSYTSAELSAQFKQSAESNKYCSVRVYLVHDKQAPEKHELIYGKYPLVNRTSSNLDVLVGPVLVNVYTSVKDFQKEKLEDTLAGLIDFEKLESMLPKQDAAAKE